MIVCTHSIVSWSDLPSILSRPMQSNPPAPTQAREKLNVNTTKWINVPNKRKVGWIKFLSLNKNDSVQFILTGNSYVNQACMTYIGSIQMYESQCVAVIEKLLQSANKGYTQMKYKCTPESVSVWVSVTEYSRIKFSILIGKEHETPFILEEPPVDAILVQ